MRPSAMDSVNRRRWGHTTCRRLHTSGTRVRVEAVEGPKLPLRCRSSSLASLALLLVAGSMLSASSAQDAFVSFVSGHGATAATQVRPRPQRPSRPPTYPSRSSEKTGGRKPENIVMGAVPISPSSLLAALGPLGFFVAGGLCSSFSHVLATPIDVIKTSQQATEEREGQCPGTFEMAMKLVKSHGPQKLLSGVGATFTGYFLHGAFKYGLFEMWKSIFRIHQVVSISGHICLLCVSALLAEMLATVVLCPAEAARIMLVADPSFMEPTRQAYERFCKQQKRGLHGIHQKLCCTMRRSPFLL